MPYLSSNPINTVNFECTVCSTAMNLHSELKKHFARIKKKVPVGLGIMST